MELDLAAKVRAAARAGWWTVILISLFMTGGWFLAIALLRAQPEWASTFWPGKVDWDEIRTIYIWAFGMMKMMVWLMVGLTIWLTFWGGRLKRLAKQP